MIIPAIYDYLKPVFRGGVVGSDDQSASDTIPGRVTSLSTMSAATTYDNTFDYDQLTRLASGRIIATGFGFTRLMATDDGGVSWSQITSDFTNGVEPSATSEMFDHPIGQLPNGRILIQSRRRGIQKSDDEGETWSVGVDWDSPTTTAFYHPSGDVHAMFGESIIWDSTRSRMVLFPGIGNTFSISTAGYNIAYTEDGDTYIGVGGSANITPSGAIDNCVIFDNGNYFLRDASDRCRYSPNGGTSWGTTSPATLTPADTTVRSVGYSSARNLALFTASGNTIYSSSDGITWTSFTPTGNPSGLTNPVWSDVYNCWFAFTAVTTRQLYYSTDDGASWTAVPTYNGNVRLRAYADWITLG